MLVKFFLTNILRTNIVIGLGAATDVFFWFLYFYSKHISSKRFIF